MLYRVVTQSDITEVRRGLEKLLDQVTPYYKAKIESLPAQQRKILDHIARVSGRTREGARPAEIAEATRLKPNQASAQLKRLSELGYIRAANLRERNSYYTLSEPLYAIWHQMRFGRDARQRLRWLVDFLKVWYDADEMRTESKRLSDSFRNHLTAGRLTDARNALDHQRLLMEAMEESLTKALTRESVIGGYLELHELEILKKEVLTSDMLPNLSRETLTALHEAGCISQEEAERAKVSAPSSAEIERKADLAAALMLASTFFREGNASAALPQIERGRPPLAIFRRAARAVSPGASGRLFGPVRFCHRIALTGTGELPRAKVASHKVGTAGWREIVRCVPPCFSVR